MSIRSLLDAVEELNSEATTMKLDIGSRFDELEKKHGNYHASRTLEKAEDLCNDLFRVKDRLRDLSRELEYLETKVSDLEYDKSSLWSQLN